MMMRDQELLQEYLERVADRFTAGELVERLEDAGIIDIWTILNNLEMFIIEGKFILEI